MYTLTILKYVSTFVIARILQLAIDGVCLEHIQLAAQVKLSVYMEEGSTLRRPAPRSILLYGENVSGRRENHKLYKRI